MEKRKNEKVASIVVSLSVIAITMFYTRDLQSVGIYSGSPFYTRLTYSFFHANILHAMLNAWCLLSIVFIYDINMIRLSLSYMSAISIPSSLLGNVPTVGLSGIVFFLFASISFEVNRKVYYQAWMIFYLVLGFIFPNSNGIIHLYCYIMGLSYALLNKPIKIQR